MKIKITSSHKSLEKILLITLLLFCFLGIVIFGVNAHDMPSESPGREITGTEMPTIEVVSPYFSIEHRIHSDGTSIAGYIINGPPHPPSAFEDEMTRSIMPTPSLSALPNFPSYSWVFGCSAVSGGMIAAYYDRGPYINMYTGPTNGGVMPLTDTSWATWTDSIGDSYPNNPLIATHNGVDGRTERGSIDDYWVSYSSSNDDPYITNGWTQHTWGDAIGDYMKTSQSAYDNVDGSTVFYNWTSSSAPLTCNDMVTYDIDALDGTYGRKLFYEARGYIVTDCFNQKTDNNGGDYTLTNFQNDIDAGHPVFLNLAGHSIVGFGYDGSTIYIRDTWSSDPTETRSFTWGGKYSGMKLLSVSVVHLQQLPPGNFSKESPIDGAVDQSTNPILSWGESIGAASYEYCYDTTNDNACTNWNSNSTSRSVALNDLINGTTYYWQVRATNTVNTTYADGSNLAFWSFTVDENILGDVNNDNLVNSTDGLIILSGDVGFDISSYCPINCGDVNGDGFVDSTDTLVILSFDVGFSIPFPGIGQPGCPEVVTQPAGCSP